MRFLFTTLQFEETRGYLRTSEELRSRDAEATHIAFSRLAARGLRRSGFRADCLPDAMAEVGAGSDIQAEVRRIERDYELPSLRSVYVTDPACHGRSEEWSVEWTVRHFRALERLLDAHRPDVLVPDIGSETMRTAAHAIALARSIPTFFLFYTMFPDPLRLYVDVPQAPIVAHEEIRELTNAERARVEEWIEAFTSRATPIVRSRDIAITPAKALHFARHVAARVTVERDNAYLVPMNYVRHAIFQRVRRRRAPKLYEPLDRDRRFLYFPLHVTDDFKVRRLTPHCVDQASLIEQVADWLPQGYDLVAKEHPRDVGRNPLEFLERITRRPNVRLVSPQTSSHDLIQDADAVVVIGSTVGVEALLYGQPVLTLGQPWYSGYGLTVDLDSFRDIPRGISRVLEFRPNREQVLSFLHAAWKRCYPGAPAGYDPSRENAVKLASSLFEAGSQEIMRRASNGRADGVAASKTLST